jgi:hypothetical protein
MSEDLTPPQYRCGIASCPSVHRLVIDGKRHLIVVGPYAAVSESPVAITTHKDLLLQGKIGDDEEAILIEEDLLSGIGCQVEVTAVGERSAASPSQSTGSAEAELLAALKEARSDIDSWAAYASEYFKDKWDLAGDLARYDAIIAKHSQRPIEEAGLPADERTAATAEASLTLKNLREENEKLRKDLGILLAQIDYLTEATGEGPDCQDAGLVEQIRRGHRAALTSPEATGEPHSRETTSEATSGGQDV